MTIFHRLFSLAFFAVSLTALGHAQKPTTSEVISSQKTIEGWLLSGDPRQVAWGAHDVLITRNRYLSPDLLSLASQWQPLSVEGAPTSSPPEFTPKQMDERDAMAAVLDTLIQMNVSVPANTLRTLASDFGNDVAVLVSRMSVEDAAPLSLDFYHSSAENNYDLQYISAELLALHPVAGFAAHLLGHITVQATIFVVSPDSGAFGRGGSSGSCGASFARPHEGWPSIGQYMLSKQKSDKSSFLLVGGIDPIYAKRVQSAHYSGHRCERGLALGAEQRRRLIAEMLSIPPGAIPWRTDVTATIKFQSVQQFDDAVLAYAREQQQKFRATVGALQAHDLVSSTEVEDSLPTLELKLMDMRHDDATPLTNLPQLPLRVEVTLSDF